MHWPALCSILLALLPVAAQALSCLPPNPARELDAAFRQGGNPQVLIGKLTTPFDNENGRYRVEGRLFGRSITINRLSSGIDVAAGCIAISAPSCPAARSRACSSSLAPPTG